MDLDTALSLVETAARFAKNEVAPMVGYEGRDGDLGKLAEVLDRAAKAGLYPDGTSERGIWDMVAEERDARPALEVLRAIARECAGVAACVHAASLGSLSADSARPISVAFFEDWPLSWQALDTPPPDCSRVSEGLLLTGRKSFVAMPPGCDAFLVHAAKEGRWRRFLVPRCAKGLVVSDKGPRTGLAALPMVDLIFEDAPLASDGVMPDQEPAEMLWRDLLGLAALALGNAEGALGSAREYAASRHQGGGLIQGHEAVQSLLGDAAAKLDGCRSHLFDVASDASGGPRRRLSRAVAAKLRITSATFHAVSGALQVLGGYGYMEDYRLEKRLRDAMTLRLMAVEPEAARRMCAAGCP